MKALAIGTSGFLVGWTGVYLFAIMVISLFTGENLAALVIDNTIYLIVGAIIISLVAIAETLIEKADEV